MTHLLLTRFNLKVASWDKTRKGYKVLTEEWLDQRFFLFETFTLPSILNQTSKKFKWLIFFDTSTPEKYKNRAKILSDTYHFVEIIYIDGIVNLMKTLKSYLKENIPSDQKLITSRLDNDDSLHKNFIETVQNYYHTNNGVLDFENGYQGVLQSRGSIDLRRYHHKFNQFISFCEIANNPSTVFGRMHTDYKTFQPQYIDKTNRFWLEIIHEMNKLNNSKSNLFSDLDVCLSDFGIDPQIIKKLSKHRSIQRNTGVFYRQKLNLLKKTIKQFING